MSLQPNNINKFPKHIQHVRIQKEEEEEQWISGEELCTEGSSDEESTNDVKKRFKNKAVHYPSKESLKIKTSSLSTASLSSAKESDEEITNSTEKLQLSPTEWRPKRGSIKLPNIDEKPLDFEMEKYNTECEYQEAIKEIKSYKNKLATINENENTENNNLYDETDYSNLSGTDSILFFDNENAKLDKMLEEYRNDRLKYQTRVCEKIRHLGRTSMELKNTKKFHEIFKYKSDSHMNKTENNKKKIKTTNKPLWKRNNKSTSHKIKNMADIVLSEREKERLYYLLADIDNEEIDNNSKDNAEQNKNKNDENLKIKSIKYENNVAQDVLQLKNAFKKTGEEQRNLDKIEEDLKTLQEMCDDADLKGKLSQEQCSIVDEENREWKAYLKLTENRFRRINEKINKLRQVDEQATKTEETTEDIQKS